MFKQVVRGEDLGEVLSENVLHTSDSVKISIRRVLSVGEEFADVRKWVIWAQDKQWHPTKQGIFLNFQDFKLKLLPLLIKLADEGK